MGDGHEQEQDQEQERQVDTTGNVAHGTFGAHALSRHDKVVQWTCLTNGPRTDILDL